LTEEDLPPVVDLSGKEDVGVAAGLVASHASTRHLTEAQETVLNGLQTALDSKLPKTGGQLTDVRESIAYEELTANKTISFAAADVLYFFINPSGSSVQLTMPADPGSLSKSGVIWVKNNTGKAHTWNTSPAIRFVSETDADTVPTPAAVGYWTRYTAQWHDNNGGAGFWAVALAGRDTA
jgi:hypothetical protein